MATRLLLPGMGGRDEQVVAVTEEAAAAESEPLDLSRCAQFAMQIKDSDVQPTSVLTVQVKQSFDGVNYADLGSPTPMVEGDILRFPFTSGPFGLIKYELSSEAGASSDSSDSATVDNVTIVTCGYPAQWSN